MTGKEELQTLENYGKELEKLDEDIEVLKLLCKEPTSSTMESRYNPTRNIESPQVRCFVDLEEKKEKRDEVYRKREELKTVVLGKILKIEEPKLKKVLIYKYVNGNTMEDTAKALNHERRYTYKLRDDAIKLYDKVI